MLPEGGSALSVRSGAPRSEVTTPELGSFSEEWVRERARRLYDEGEARMGLDPQRSALLVVDMIDEFVKPHWSPYWVPQATEAVPRIREVIDAFHGAGLPVIYLAYRVDARGLNTPITDRLVPTTMDVEPWVSRLWQEVSIYQEIAPTAEDIVVLKHSYSGFHGTELELVLRSLDVSTVVVSGTLTNFCCGATAREAFWRGFQVIFGSDINATDDEAMHEAELRVLRRGYARIMTAAEIVDTLAHRTGASAAEIARR
jgi:nicotinamidase-related amidase